MSIHRIEHLAKSLLVETCQPGEQRTWRPERDVCRAILRDLRRADYAPNGDERWLTEHLEEIREARMEWGSEPEGYDFDERDVFDFAGGRGR